MVTLRKLIMLSGMEAHKTTSRENPNDAAKTIAKSIDPRFRTGSRGNANGCNSNVTAAEDEKANHLGAREMKVGGEEIDVMDVLLL
jgi:hypothetical protein